jgi:hypothetical protein
MSVTSVRIAPTGPGAGLSRSARLTTGVLLIGVAVFAAAGAGWLSAVFSWPDILDAPGGTAIPAFLAAESAIRTAFYFMLVSSLLLIPAAIYLEQVVGGPASPAVRTVTAFGVLGGFAQILGWVRWPVTMPHLAEAYAAADETTRTAVAASYDVLNRYAGGALGEHLGWLFQGLWAVGLAILLLRVAGVPRWFSYLGLALSITWWPTTWGSGLVNLEWLAPVGTTVSVVWFLWLLALGVMVMVRRVQSPLTA